MQILYKKVKSPSFRRRLFVIGSLECLPIQYNAMYVNRVLGIEVAASYDSSMANPQCMAHRDQLNREKGQG